jgi:hypothetical protein
LNDGLKKRESENNKLASDKEKLEAYTKKALHNVQEKVPPSARGELLPNTELLPFGLTFHVRARHSICWQSKRAKSN